MPICCLQRFRIASSSELLPRSPTTSVRGLPPRADLPRCSRTKPSPGSGGSPSDAEIRVLPDLRVAGTAGGRTRPSSLEYTNREFESPIAHRIVTRSRFQPLAGEDSLARGALSSGMVVRRVFPRTTPETRPGKHVLRQAATRLSLRQPVRPAGALAGPRAAGRGSTRSGSRWWPRRSPPCPPPRSPRP